MGRSKSGLSGEFIIHPGETIQEILEDRQMSQKELAIRTDVTEAHVSKIVNAQKGISVGYAKKLAYALGIESSFWVNLQAQYDREVGELEEASSISRQECAVLKKLGEISNYLKAVGLLDKQAYGPLLVIGLRQLLRVSSLLRLPDLAQVGAYRLATATTIDPYILPTWLRMCDVLIEKQHISQTLDVHRLKGKIPEIKRLLFKDAAEIEGALKEHLNDCGIRFLIVKHFTGAPVQGVIKKYPDNTLSLIMTHRRKSADIFWFTFFHEIGHILNGDIKGNLIEYDTGGGTGEWDADRFASNVLINTVSYTEFVHQGDFTLSSIRRFAARLSVPPFMVIGRLQRDNHLEYSHYAEEKVMYELG